MYRLSQKKYIPGECPTVLADFERKCDAIDYMDFLVLKYRKSLTLVDVKWTLYNTDFEVVHAVTYQAETMVRLITKNDRNGLTVLQERAKKGEVIRLI